MNAQKVSLQSNPNAGMNGQKVTYRKSNPNAQEWMDRK